MILAEEGRQVELFEARRQMGGRAGSFVDPRTGALLDHCQHVGMACCTNLIDFYRRTCVTDLFQRYHRLNFFGPDGQPCLFQQSRWLPAPLHLLSSLARMRYLPLVDRLRIVAALWRLARIPSNAQLADVCVAQWLRQQGQSDLAIRRFWNVVLVSALGERLDRAPLAAARKVLVDGFLRTRGAYAVDVPRVSLGQIYDDRIAPWLARRGVHIHRACRVLGIDRDAQGIIKIRWADSQQLAVDFAVLAVPWRRVIELLPAEIVAADTRLQHVTRIESSPISAVHLCFDRPIINLPHAVLVDRLSQWVFDRTSTLDDRSAITKGTEFHYQVVISGSRELMGRPREEILGEVLQDLSTIWPAVAQAELRHWRLVHQADAVFSVGCGPPVSRPGQRTSIPNLMLAGDWTDTGWPSTMESAVRSGYLAAQLVLEQLGQPRQVLVPDLPSGWLARWIVR